MNLHHDHEAFSELIVAASNELHIPPGIVEKDYYVTLALRELASRVKGMVFKGSTSLTKCYQILDCFSEDIDISYAASEGIPDIYMIYTRFWNIQHLTFLCQSLFRKYGACGNLSQFIRLPKKRYISMTFWQRLWIRKHIEMIMKRLLARCYLHISRMKLSLNVF